MIRQSTCHVCVGTGTIVKKKCKHCSGGYVASKKTTSIDIPAGIDSTQQIAMFNECTRVVINLAVDNKCGEITRVNSDLHINVFLNYAELLRGVEDFEVEIFDSKYKVKIPAKILPGKSIRMRGKGMPVMNAAPAMHGDCFVNINLKFEEHSDEDLIKLNNIFEKDKHNEAVS
jgi:molecular chaperone DnaJ